MHDLDAATTRFFQKEQCKQPCIKGTKVQTNVLELAVELTVLSIAGSCFEAAPPPSRGDAPLPSRAGCTKTRLTIASEVADHHQVMVSLIGIF